MKKHATVFDGLYAPYDKSEYPGMTAFFGVDRMPSIEANRVKAAEMVAALLPPGKIIGNSLPVTEEEHRNNALFLVDTEDNQRFLVTEEQVRNGFTIQEVSAGDGCGKATEDQITAAKERVLAELSHLVGDITFTSISSEIRNHGVVNVGIHFTHPNDYDEVVESHALCRFLHKETDGNIVFPK